MTVTIFKTNNPGSDDWYNNPKYEQKQTWNFLMLLTRQLFYLPSHLRHSFHPDCRSALNTFAWDILFVMIIRVSKLYFSLCTKNQSIFHFYMLLVLLYNFLFFFVSTHSHLIFRKCIFVSSDKRVCGVCKFVVIF